MQRFAVFSQSVSPSSQRSPKLPRDLPYNQGLLDCKCELFTCDLEKGEKLHWRWKAEQAVHLIPVLLLACVLVLYVCSSTPNEEIGIISSEVRIIGMGKTTILDRHLQQMAQSLEAEESNSTSDVEVERELRQLHSITTLRGVKRK